MSWIDDMFGGGDLSTIDPITAGDMLSMDDFDPSEYFGGLDLSTLPPITNDYLPVQQLPGLDSGIGAMNDGNFDVGGGFWQQIGRMITGSKNPTAGSVLAGLLPMALSGVSGAMNRSATNDATAQTLAGLNKASDQATQLINGASQGYQPFMQAGTSALSKLSSQAPSNLAAQFGSLAGQFAPLGSGRGIKSPGGR